MLPLWKALLLVPYLGIALASVLPVRPEAGTIHARAAPANGSCISAPDTACVSLVGLCVTKIASGQVGSTAYWTDSVCVAAATCASMGSVLDAACCAGTCKKPTDIGVLDVNTVYRAMVGSGCTSSSPQTCSLTWQPFVDWFYNTIQATGTNLYPVSGDDVLAKWEDIATWTGFCVGDRCVEGVIPYSNFNDWFHFSSAIIATSPGTPQYVPIFPTLDENLDNLTPNILWPCLLDNEDDCWWDYGPPLPGTVQGPDLPVQATQQTPSSAGSVTQGSAKLSVGGSSGPPKQPIVNPPPVYVNGELFPLVLNGKRVEWNVTNTRRAVDLPRALKAPAPRAALEADHKVRASANTSESLGELAITPATCRTTTDIPTTLPTLTYFCPFFPGICQNIRSHPDWDAATDTMELTYDPFDGGKRRNGLCTTAVKKQMQTTGSCDPRQHDSNYWKTSCDEFPFSSTLEGGVGNSVVLAVSNAEQDLQGTLQSSITYLLKTQNDGQTAWGTGKKKMCHRYLLKLVDAIPAGAPGSQIGILDPGSQFFLKTGSAIKPVMNINALTPVPPTFAVDTPYDPSQTAMTVPKLSARFNCAPCPPSSPSPSPAVNEDPDDDDDTSDRQASVPSPTSAQLVKRQASSCTVPPGPPLATNSAGASSVAAASASTASAAAAAAAAALASAADASAAEAAAAAAAVAAANVLGPAADALAAASSDASLAAAIAASQAALSAAQSALNDIFFFGPSIPDWLTNVVHSVSSSTSSVSNAVDSSSNVINPTTPLPPDVDPSRDPVINAGPPPGTPAAACFGAGSKGFMSVNGDPLVDPEDPSQLAAATLVDEGSDAYFGLTLPRGIRLAPLGACNSVFMWMNESPAADFQVDCATNEVGSYWEGVKQQCYAYSFPGTNMFDTICGNNIGNIYACLQSLGMYGTVNSVVFTWSSS